MSQRILMDQNNSRIVTARRELKRKICYFAVYSRMFVLLVSFVSDVLIPDHEARVFQSPLPTLNKTLADRAVQVLFGGLCRWDAQYFLHIAHYGYTYENTLAFYPLFPFFVRTFGAFLTYFLGSFLNQTSTVLISSVIINLIMFTKASTTLFDLSCKVLDNGKLAYISALFFCINPASIFFTAPYSESCFAFFAFSAMVSCYNNDMFSSSLAAGLSSGIRSNGIVNFGFIAHNSLKDYLSHFSLSNKFCSILTGIFVDLLKFVFYVTIFLMPFLMFQVYAYSLFCFGKVNIPSFLEEFGRANSFVMAGSKQLSWCNFKVPFSYSYVQNHYWNLGLLNYYQIKQIPNFLLAFPVIYLLLGNIISFMCENIKTLFSLGLTNEEHVRFQGVKVKPEFFVFVVHALFLTLFCIFFIHIQVATRLLASSCPILYWFISIKYRTLSDSDVVSMTVPSRLKKLKKSHGYSLIETKNNLNSYWKTYILTEKPANAWSYFVRLYFYVYMFVGTVMFSNHLPWT